MNPITQEELKGSGVLLGYRALWQRLKQKYGLFVARYSNEALSYSRIYIYTGHSVQPYRDYYTTNPLQENCYEAFVMDKSSRLKKETPAQAET